MDSYEVDETELHGSSTAKPGTLTRAHECSDGLQTLEIKSLHPKYFKNGRVNSQTNIAIVTNASDTYSGNSKVTIVKMHQAQRTPRLSTNNTFQPKGILKAGSSYSPSARKNKAELKAPDDH